MKDPWDEFNDAPTGGFAAGDPEHAAPQNVAPASTPPSANMQPVQPSTTVDAYGGFTDAPAQVQGGFADEQPQRAASHLSEADEAEYARLAHTASAEDLQRFQEQRGFTSDIDKLRQFVAARDAAKAKGRPVDYNHAYELPKAVDSSAAQAFGDHLTQGATLGTSDEIHGFLNGVDALLNGKGYTDAYNRTVDQDRAQLGADDQQYGTLSTIGDLAGGLVLPFGLEKSGLTAGLEAVGLAAGRDALVNGATKAEARVIAARAVARRLTTEGGAYGAAYGAGTADGDASQRLLGAATGGAEGVAGGALLGRLGVRSAGRAASPAVATAGQDVAQAAARQGLDVLPADVGGPVTRGLTAAVAQTPLGVLPIAKAAARLDDQAAARLGEIASGLGDAAGDREGVGQAALDGVQRYAQLAKRAGGRLYDIAADKAGDAKVDLTQTKALVDQQIARLQAVPGGGQGLSDLQSLRASLDQPATVQGVRDMRTEMFVSPEFRNTPVEGRMKQVVNAASNDLEQGLRDQGRGDAADAYRAADDHWRDMLTNLRKNIEPVVGKMSNLKSPEGVATALNSAMKNNGGRVGALIGSLPDEQQGIVRASMLSPLGRDNSGTFSISRFATDWNKLSPAAKRSVFGPEATSALNDLATVGDGAKQAMKYANHSNTARALITERTIGSLATGATLAGGASTFGIAAVAPYITGRLLASPRFARWLARAPRTSLGSAAYIDRLGRIARAEPAIAGDILSLRQGLERHLAGAPMQAAASPNDAFVGNGNAGSEQTPAGELQP